MIKRDVKSLLIENRGQVDQIDCLKKRIAELEAERDALNAKVQAFVQGADNMGAALTATAEAEDRLEALVERNHTDAMIGHRFFESLLGESACGRDFAIKVPMAEGRITELKASVRNQQGDNLCWFDGSPPIPPKAEFLESCRRYHDQIATQNGVLEGGRTIAQLEARIAELEAERDVLTVKVAHLYKLSELPFVSLGIVCEDRDKLKHSDRALRAEIAALRKALDDAPHARECASLKLQYPVIPFASFTGALCRSMIGCGNCEKCLWIAVHPPAYGPCDCRKSRIP